MGIAPGQAQTAAVLIALVALVGCAQEVASESAASAIETGAQEAAPAAEIGPHEMSCAEIKELLDDEASEEEASYLTVWAYGVRTGAKGLDFEKHPVTVAGLEQFVTGLILVCQADPEKLFVDAILE